MNQPLQHDRDLSKLRDAWGIKDEGFAAGVEVEPLVKPVVIVDDARHLVRPLTVPQGTFYATAPNGGLGTYAYHRVICSAARGGVITHATVSNVLTVVTQTAPAGVDTLGALQAPVLQGSDRALADTTVHVGFNDTVPSFFDYQMAASNTAWELLPFWLEPGVPLWFHMLVANTASVVRVSIQEIA